MNETELQKLKDVLVERLSSGDDPRALQHQLAREFSSTEAARLIAEAAERLEAGREDPAFARSIEDVRKRREAARSRRPLTDPSSRKLRVTAGVFGAIGVISILGSATRGLDLSTIIAGLLFAVPAARLWHSNSAIAAGVLMAVCGLACLGSTVFAISTMRDAGLAPFTLSLLWLGLLAVAVRAFMIARPARRRSVATPMADVFD